MNENYNEKDYCYRIFYDIGYGAGFGAKETFSDIKPTCADFLKSDEYFNGNKSLYESAEEYFKAHGWSAADNAIDYTSAEFKTFDSFVTVYNELSNKGVEFTIDDNRFEFSSDTKSKNERC